MRILVLSDSHRMFTNLYRVFDTLLEERLDVVLHLGDNTEDVLGLADRHKDVDFYMVRGNSDYSGVGEYERLVGLSGKKIYMTHGHRHNVKGGLQRLVYAAEEKEADICLYGHTHISNLFAEGGMVFMNPGSISIPRDGGAPCYGIIEIGDKSSYAGVVSIQKYGLEVKYSIPL